MKGFWNNATINLPFYHQKRTPIQCLAYGLKFMTKKVIKVTLCCNNFNQSATYSFLWSALNRTQSFVMLLESLILQHMDIPWMMASQDKRAIAMKKNAADILKVGPVYSTKSCSTRKGHPFKDYLKLVRSYKRALKSAYRVITEDQCDSYSVVPYYLERQIKDTNDAYCNYCCVHMFVHLWCTQLPLFLIERQ